MKNLIEIIKFAILSVAIIFVGQLFLVAYKNQIRNQAIDGCAQSSLYQSEFIDQEGRQITVQEPQKHLYDLCLAQKGITF